jgi:tRNA-2-methylthio-N6-dimethylallyladenosine synthase
MSLAHHTFYLRTYGCQMNERDSEALACMLAEQGLRRVDSEAEADILLFNTCSVRDQAERKVFGKVGLLKKLKRSRPEVIIGIIGCMAQNYGRQLLDELPHVDLVIGTDRLHLLPEILDEALLGHRGLVHVEPGTEVARGLHGHEQGKISAFVSVMRGCNQFCSYCIVPFVRGREKSRPAADIITEVTSLAANGVKEIFLLGQNITAYGVAEAQAAGTYTPELSPFADLLRQVDAVAGVERIRFTSPHPRFMNQAFIEAATGLPRVCEAFHIPLQSGSNRILKQMRRGYTAEMYLNVVQQIRERLPQVCFTTDIIVGFPGETEADFAATREMMEEVGFEMAYIFKYSPRTGTKAAETADDVPVAVKEERNRLLLADLEARSAAANRRYIGQFVEVLVEGESKRNPQRWTGRSRTGKVCLFTPPPGLARGDMITLQINRSTANSLFGKVAQS